MGLANPNDQTFALATNLRVLYLNSNFLVDFPNLSFCGQTLTHLYLQHNHIRILPAHILSSLVALQKLWLGSNEIGVLQGFGGHEETEMLEYERAETEREEQQQAEKQRKFEQQQAGGGEVERGEDGRPSPPSRRSTLVDGAALSAAVAAAASAAESSISIPLQPRERPALPPPTPFNLVELHMDHQRLDAEAGGLYLSLRSLQALSRSLRILTLAGNQMDGASILGLSLLSHLTSLDLSANAIGRNGVLSGQGSDLKILEEVVSAMPELQVLDLRNNPINTIAPGANVTSVTLKKYRDAIVKNSVSLTLLDDKEVPANQRDYLHALSQAKKQKRAQAAAAGGGGGAAGGETEGNTFKSLYAPPAFPYQPRVLTLRSSSSAGHLHASGVHGGMMGGAGGMSVSGSTVTPQAQAVNVRRVGGMGAGSRHTLARGTPPPPHTHSRTPSFPSIQRTTSSSSQQFQDDDPNLMTSSHPSQQVDLPPIQNMNISASSSSASSSGQR